MPPYFVRGVNYNTEEHLVVVESAVKAIAVSAHVAPAIGLGGVATTHAAGALGAGWEALDLRGRTVVILFDANRSKRPAVAHAEAQISRALRAAGAEVRIARLDLLDEGGEAGPDDLIARLGADMVRSAVEDAVSGDPLNRVKSEVASDLIADLGFWAAVYALEPGDQQSARAVWGAREMKGVGVSIFDKMLKSFSDRLRSAGGFARAPAYDVVDGCLCTTVHGKPDRVLLTGVVRILEEHISEHGTFTFWVEATGQDGRPAGTASVEPNELEQSDWLAKHFGTSVSLHARPGELRAALTSMSTPKRVRVVDRTGFMQTEQGAVFLYNGGHAGAQDASVRAELEGPLAGYDLPFGRVHAVAAFRHALTLFQFLKPVQALVLLAAMACAVLSDIAPVRFCLVLVGRSQSLKTTLAHVALSFFGTFDRKKGTVDVMSTPASIEDVLHRAKDVITVIDDFAPGSNAVHADRVRTVVEQVIRGIGNGSNRSRMTADMKRRADRPPRGLAIITAEESPGQTESIQARCVMTRLVRGDVNLAQLSAFQVQLDILPAVTRDLVDWVIEDRDGVARLRADEEVAARRHLPAELGSHRAVGAVADLRAGFGLFLAAAERCGAVSPEERAALSATADAALAGLLREQEVARSDADAAEAFMDAFYAAWGSGALQILGTSSARHAAHGYFDAARGRVYLHFDQVWNDLAARRRSAGEALGAKKHEVLERLRDDGRLRLEERGRFTVKVPLQGRPRMTDMAIEKERVPAHAISLPDPHAGFKQAPPASAQGETAIDGSSSGPGRDGVS